MTFAKINSLRASIADKQAERAAVESQRVSHDELRVALETQVARAADVAKGAAWRIGVASYEGGVLAVKVDNDGRADVLPAMVALFGADVVLSNLERHIEAVPSRPTAAERKVQIAAVDAEIEKLERAEEAAGRVLEASGAEYLRRRDASPAVVLGGL